MDRAVTTARAAMFDLSEQEWQRRVTDTATVNGWLWVHIRAQRTGRKVRTGAGLRDAWQVPYEGSKGLPDLIMARGGRTLLVELKTNAGRLTPE